MTLEGAFAGKDIAADRRQQQAEGRGDECLRFGATADGGHQQDAEQCQRRVFGRSEVQGETCHDGRKKSQPDDGGGTADKRTDGRQSECRSGFALSGHLVAVEDRDHRRCLTWKLEEYGGDGAAVLRPVENSGEHDDGGDGFNVVGQREQDGDGCRGPQSGQHPDQHANNNADEAVQEIGRLQDDGKAVDHGIQKIHGCLLEKVGNGGVERQDEDAVERCNDDCADQQG